MMLSGEALITASVCSVGGLLFICFTERNYANRKTS